MTIPANRLRDLISGGRHFVAAEAYSALTGRIVESVGFKAAYLGGHACSAFHYAVPDNGVFSQVEQIEQAARIARTIDIALIVDADTLGETVADAYHFARRYIGQGIAGIHVEDERNPKHSKFVNGLSPIRDMQARIDAIVQARRDTRADLVVIARCDEMYTSEMGGGGGGSLDEAIRRGRAYGEAGADAILFVPRPEPVPALAKAMQVPVCTLGFDIPGTAFTLSSGWGWVTAAVGHLRMAKELMETGSVSSAIYEFPEKYDLLEHPVFDRLVEQWANGTGRISRPNHAP